MLAKARIMVVEDEALIVLDLQNMLKNLGYDVSDPARSGAEALAWRFRHTPRLNIIWVHNALAFGRSSHTPTNSSGITESISVLDFLFGPTLLDLDL